MDVRSNLFTQAVTIGQVGFAGMAAGSRIRTLEGELPVEFLVPGDRIVTRAGARRLESVSVRQAREADIIRVSASSLGHGRPDSDLLVGPGQLLVVRDWRARALYGCEQAAVPASRLADGEYIKSERHGLVRLFTLRFAEDEVIWAEGIELACRAVPATPRGPVRSAPGSRAQD